MSAAELRKAAATLRERAKATDRVTPGWFEAQWLTWLHEPENAEWIATMHPGVGLALADWLDHSYRQLGRLEPADSHPGLIVARLINVGAE